MMVERSSGQVSPPELLSNTLPQLWISFTMILLQMFWSFIASKPGETLEMQEWEEKKTQIGTAFWGNWSYFECSQQIWIHLAHLMILNSCAKLRQSLNFTSNNRHTLVHTHTWIRVLWEYREHFIFCILSDLFLAREHHPCIPADGLEHQTRGVREFIFRFYHNRMRSRADVKQMKSAQKWRDKLTDHNNYYHHWLHLVMDLLALNERQHRLLAGKYKSENDKLDRKTPTLHTGVVKVCETTWREVRYLLSQRVKWWNSLKDTWAKDGGEVEGGHAVLRVVELHLREEAAQVAEETVVHVWKLLQQISQVRARDVIATLFGVTTAGTGQRSGPR